MRRISSQPGRGEITGLNISVPATIDFLKESNMYWLQATGQSLLLQFGRGKKHTLRRQYRTNRDTLGGGMKA